MQIYICDLSMPLAGGSGLFWSLPLQLSLHLQSHSVTSLAPATTTDLSGVLQYKMTNLSSAYSLLCVLQLS